MPYTKRRASRFKNHGCGGGNFCPDNGITRAEMVIFLLRTKHGGSYVPPAARHYFSDMSGHWAERWADQLYREGITGGCTTNPRNYCPNNNLTRAEMAVFLLRGKHGGGYGPPAASHYFADAYGHWAEAWIDQLYREGITVGCASNPLRYCPDDPVMRGPMAYLLVVVFNIVAYAPERAMAAAEINSPEMNRDEQGFSGTIPAPPIGNKVLAMLLHAPLQAGIEAHIVYDGDGKRVIIRQFLEHNRRSFTPRDVAPWRHVLRRKASYLERGFERHL